MELALIADRADITEECVRLRSHLINFFKESIKDEKEPGKKLNFLCQENEQGNKHYFFQVNLNYNYPLLCTHKGRNRKIKRTIQNIE